MSKNMKNFKILIVLVILFNTSIRAQTIDTLRFYIHQSANDSFPISIILPTGYPHLNNDYILHADSEKVSFHYQKTKFNNHNDSLSVAIPVIENVDISTLTYQKTDSLLISPIKHGLESTSSNYINTFDQVFIPFKYLFNGSTKFGYIFVLSPHWLYCTNNTEFGCLESEHVWTLHFDGFNTNSSVTNSSNIEQADIITSSFNTATGIFKVFPNPATTHLNIVANQSINSILLHNLKGQLMQSYSSEYINLKGLCKGVYFLTVHFSTGTKNVQKIVIN